MACKINSGVLEAAGSSVTKREKENQEKNDKSLKATAHFFKNNLEPFVA